MSWYKTAKEDRWKRIDSSFITSVLYDKKLQTLSIKLKSGSMYEFKDVSRDVYKKFLKSQSKGRFFNDVIKKKYIWSREAYSKSVIKTAGWWAIDSVETGQINWDQPEKEDGPINAIPEEDTKEELYNGDGPADIMDGALKDIANQYRESWNRDPKPEELEAVFNFCFNGWKRQRQG